MPAMICQQRYTMQEDWLISLFTPLQLKGAVDENLVDNTFITTSFILQLSYETMSRLLIFVLLSLTLQIHITTLDDFLLGRR